MHVDQTGLAVPHPARVRRRGVVALRQPIQLIAACGDHARRLGRVIDLAQRALPPGARLARGGLVHRGRTVRPAACTSSEGDASVARSHRTPDRASSARAMRAITRYAGHCSCTWMALVTQVFPNWSVINAHRMYWPVSPPDAGFSNPVRLCVPKS